MFPIGEHVQTYLDRVNLMGENIPQDIINMVTHADMIRYYFFVGQTHSD